MGIYSRARFWEHDNRHTLITELCESGAGDQTIMSIAGHVPRAMLSRYAHVRMEAKGRPWTRLRCDSARPMRSARKNLSGGSSLRRLVNQ